MKEHKTLLSHLTNEQIKEAIYFMIETVKEFQDINFANSGIKAREIGIYMMNLTNESDLDEIIEKIQTAGIVKYDPEQIKALLLRLYKDNDKIAVSAGVKAKHYGVITQYLGFEKVASFAPDVPIPELYVEYKDGRVYSNLHDLIQSTCRKLEFAKSVEIQKLPFEERKLAFKKDINEKLDFKLTRNTLFLDEFITYSKEKLNYAYDGFEKKSIPKINPYPNIFSRKDDYCTNLFKYLLEESELKRRTSSSTIYHYFKLNGYFSSNLTQEKYIKFLKKGYDIEISKIFQTNDKTKYTIKNTFNILEQTFKTEWNKTHPKENETK